MAISPPASPHSVFERPSSAARHVQRSSSRMSVGTKPGGSSKGSDEDTKTAVKVGEYKHSREPSIPVRSTYRAIRYSCAGASSFKINRRGF